MKYFIVLFSISIIFLSCSIEKNEPVEGHWYECIEDGIRGKVVSIDDWTSLYTRWKSEESSPFTYFYAFPSDSGKRCVLWLHIEAKPRVYYNIIRIVPVDRFILDYRPIQ